jgi:hypothetical protein
LNIGIKRLCGALPPLRIFKIVGFESNFFAYYLLKFVESEYASNITGFLYSLLLLQFLYFSAFSVVKLFQVLIVFFASIKTLSQRCSLCDPSELG